MKFYTKQHQHCCGIDLHARTMYLRNVSIVFTGRGYTNPVREFFDGVHQALACFSILDGKPKRSVTFF